MTKNSSSIARLRAARERIATSKGVETDHFAPLASGHSHQPHEKPVDTRPPLADRLKALLKAKKPQRTTVELAILPQRRPWTSQDGRVTMICDLEDEHLVNVLFLLKRRAITQRLNMMDKKYNSNRTVAKHWVLGQGYSTGSQPLDPSVAGSVVHESIERGEDPYTAIAKVLLGQAKQTDYSEDTTWEDFTDVSFHVVRLEALRRGLNDAITLLMTDRLRLKD